jgi:hypothetical protein
MLSCTHILKCMLSKHSSNPSYANHTGGLFAAFIFFPVSRRPGAGPLLPCPSAPPHRARAPAWPRRAQRPPHSQARLMRPPSCCSSVGREGEGSTAEQESAAVRSRRRGEGGGEGGGEGTELLWG